MSLAETAETGYKRYKRIISRYKFSATGLSPQPELKAYVDAIMAAAIPAAEFDEDVYIQNLQDGQGRHLAARNSGGDPRAVKRRLKFDIDLRERVELAEEEAAERLEEKLWTLANLGERWAMEAILKKRYKQRWGDDPTIVHHEGTVTHELSAAPLLEQIAQLESTLNNRMELTSGDYIDAEIVEDK